MTRAITFSGRQASQNEHELSAFIRHLIGNNVKSYLEIGARHGDTFHRVMTALGRDVRGIAVDMPGGLWGKASSVDALHAAINDLSHRGFKDVHVILGDSTHAEIIRQCKNFGPFDAILIDGDHTLEGVTKDWNNYKTMSRIIAFHDIVGVSQSEKTHGNAVEVPTLWQSICNDHEWATTEFIDSGSTMGIGVCIRSAS